MSYGYRNDRFFIGGEWIEPLESDRLDVVSPANGTIIGSVPAGSARDIDRAVKAAKQALVSSAWPVMGIADRAEYLRRAAAIFVRRRQEFGLVAADESGMPIKIALPLVDKVVTILNYYADLSASLEIEEYRVGRANPLLVRREPVGVVGIITPWNAPLPITHFSLVPALLAGCAVVLKPAPETPLYAQMLAELYHEAGLPAGVLNVVPADREASEALVRHPDVDKISFTGSTETGRRIAGICAGDFRRVSLELGGKSAAIILDDADLAQSMPGVVATALQNSGQACVGQTRILAPRGRYAEAVKAFADLAADKVVGDPHDAGVDIGPLISDRQRQKVEEYVEAGRRAGAKLALGGQRPARLPRGWYVEPTVFFDVDNDMRIAREEIFGPVVSIIPYDDEAEAVAIANDSPYGLSGTVWTTDLSRGLGIARKIRTGNFGVNAFGLDVAAPFGGFKTSGVGRQLGPEGLESFFELKAVHLPPSTDLGQIQANRLHPKERG